MATNTLNLLYSTEQKIKTLESELKILRAQEKDLINQVLKSGNLENRYYMLTSSVRKGDRVINVAELQEKYPEVYQSCLRVSVTVTDAQKYLGDAVIDEISIRKPDSITWHVEKKVCDGVIVV